MAWHGDLSAEVAELFEPLCVAGFNGVLIERLTKLHDAGALSRAQVRRESRRRHGGLHVTITCAMCGARAKARTGHRRFCGDPCRYRWERLEHLAAADRSPLRSEQSRRQEAAQRRRMRTEAAA